MSKRPPKIGLSEIEEALKGRASPIGNPEELAELLGLSRSTVYEWLARGRLDGAFRKRGKHVLVWLARAIDLIFNGPEWEKEC